MKTTLLIVSAIACTVWLIDGSRDALALRNATLLLYGVVWLVGRIGRAA